MLMLKKDMFRV